MKDAFRGGEVEDIKISIVGCGYVGTVTGVCFAKLGNDVLCIDIDAKKVGMINQGVSPIYEKGLNDILSNNKNRIKATTNLESSIKNSDVTFICVGTPSKKDSNIDPGYRSLRRHGDCRILRRLLYS